MTTTPSPLRAKQKKATRTSDARERTTTHRSPTHDDNLLRRSEGGGALAG